MATIRAAIALYNGVTGPLNSMNRAMNIVINSFETMQNTSANAVDVSAIQEARDELARAETAFNEIEQSIRDADAGQRRFNDSVRGGTTAAAGLWRKMKGVAAAVGGMVGLKKMVEISDQLSSATARLRNAQENFSAEIHTIETHTRQNNVDSIENVQRNSSSNEWIQKDISTVENLQQNHAVSETMEQTERITFTDNGTLSELQKQVMASAQRSRSAYFDTAAAQMNYTAFGLPEVVDQAAQFSGLGENQVVQMEFSGVGLPEVQQQVEQFNGMGVNQTAQVTFTDDGSIADLQKQVMASAQRSRSAYFDTAAAVAKMGMNARDAFTGMDEVIAFTELVNKSFVIGGANVQEQSAAMLQLTQAMASGVLRGDELNSIFEQAPGIVQAIAGHLGVSIGEVRGMASEGLITANIVKNAMFDAADDIEQKFDNMPKTWAQRWTMMKNKALSIFFPILEKINQLANNPIIDSITGGIMDALTGVARIGSEVLDVLITVAATIVSHWSWISPIIYGVAAAMAVYYGQLMLAKAGELALAAVHGTVAVARGMLAAATMLVTGATWAQSTAQWSLNAAMYACPIVWIMALVIALVAVFYAGVAAVNKFAETSVSATGIICGAVAVAGAFILNLAIGLLNGLIQLLWRTFVEPFLGIIEWLLNVCNGGFDSFGGAVANLIGNIISWFLSLGKVVTTIIDAIFGTDWTSGLSSLQAEVISWGKNENAVTFDRNAPSIDYRIEYSGAWGAGYDFGVGIEDRVSGLFDFSQFDPLGAGKEISGSVSALDGIYRNTGENAANTASMRDALDYTEESLSYLRDIAEREAINRFTTAEIHVDMSGMQNTVNNGMDLDGVLSGLTEAVNEAVYVMAEGVHV